MTSFLRRAKDRFTTAPSDPNATKPGPAEGILTARAPDALFPRTRPSIDGEDCLHDCTTCTINLPRGFKIDEEEKLFGHVNGWSRHLVVATGKTDWVRDVAEEKGSVMEAVEKFAGGVEGGKLMVSASNMLPAGPGEREGMVGGYGPERQTAVLLLPAAVFVEGVTPTNVPELIKSVINPAATNISLLHPTTTSIPRQHTNDPNPTSLPAGLTLRPCTHKYIILMCSQATRDARCGQTAPLLRRELERHLRPLGLYRDLDDDRPGGVGIYFISHVGGHKYSANLMIYRRGEMEGSGEAGQCIWLARVRPEDCENIVRYTVLQGKVVKPERQLRGGFDRERGVVSW